MGDWDGSLVDPTDRITGDMIIRSVGGRAGPVAYENGAKITFPWKRQQQISGSKPGEIWVRDGSDPANSLDAQTMFIIGADVNDIADADRPKLRLDSYYANGNDSSATLAAGDSPAAGLQTRVRVTTGLINLETVPLWTSGGATDGQLVVSGTDTHFAEVSTSPDTDTRVAPIALIQRNFSGGSFTYGGTALLLGHGFVQSGLVGGSPNTIAFGSSDLLLNPQGGPVKVGTGGVDISTPLGQWTAYTPVITQGGAVTKTVQYARYMKIGRLVIAQGYMNQLGNGTNLSGITISLPFTAVQASIPAGGIYWYDASANVNFHTVGYLASTTTMGGLINASAAVLGTGGAGWPTQLQTNDALLFHIVYESTT